MTADQALTEPPWSTRASVPEHALAVGLTVLYHPDLGRVGEIAVLLDRGSLQVALIGRTTPAFRKAEGKATGGLGVGQVSDRGPLRITGLAAGAVRVELPEPRMQVELDGAALSEPLVLGADALSRGVVLVLGRTVALLLHTVEVAGEVLPELGLVGASRSVRDLRKEILRVADRDVPVLLRGETGVGKELVAAAIHEQSRRKVHPYVPINVAAIPASMAEAELFGYVRGAFTGAPGAYEGHFERADRGTLFLDEVGEAAQEIQVKLLRILEDKLLQPLGGKPRKVDVRLVTATDKDLERAVADGSFRGPLLQRIAGYVVRVPPLRERRDDIARLFLHFLRAELTLQDESNRLESAKGDNRPWLPLSFMLGLIQHTWPGNVRELLNAARYVAIANRGAIQFRTPDSLRSLVGTTTQAASAVVLATTSAGTTVPPVEEVFLARSNAPEANQHAPRPSKPARELSDDDIIAALERNAFNISRTAAELGISRTTLHTRIEACPGLRKASDLKSGEIRAALSASDGDVALAAARLRVSDRALMLHMRRVGVVA